MEAAARHEPQPQQLTPEDRAFIRRSARGAVLLLGVLLGAPVLVAALVLSVVGIANGELVMALAGPVVAGAAVVLGVLIVVLRGRQLRRDLAAGIKLVWEGPIRLDSKSKGRAQVYYILVGSHRIEVPAFIHGRMDPGGVYHVEHIPHARMALRIHELRTGEVVFPPSRNAVAMRAAPSAHRRAQS